MLQRYKLRLSDGTVLRVDEDGLSTWLVDEKAMVQVAGSYQWRPLREFLAEERAAVNRAPRPTSSARDALPLIPPPPRPRKDDSSRGVAGPSSSAPPELLSIGEPPAVQVLADEPGVSGTPAASTAWTPAEELAVIPFKKLDDETPVRPSRRVPAEHSAVPPGGGTTPTPDDSLPIIRLKPSEDEPVRPNLQVLAEDPAALRARDTRTASTATDRLPVIPLKPLDDEPSARASAGRGPTGGILLRAVSACGTLLSRCLDPLAPFVRDLPSASADEPATWPAPRRSPGRAFGWLEGLTARIRRLAHPDRPRAPLPPTEPAPTKAAAPVPREVLKPPLAISELPVLRFRDVDEPKDAGDIYEGEEGESLFPTVWLWTKRIVLMAGLVAGGIYAALTWESWFPKAARLGQMLFAEVDRRARSGDQAERQRRALEQAAVQLPHLAPETIRLVESSSPGGVLEPPDLFELACDAADRGRSALSPGEAEELAALRRELLDGLSPTERQRVRDYDGARARRVIFPFENRAALQLVARAARALPPRSRERLQELLGRAIAAGLASPADATPPDTARR